MKIASLLLLAALGCGSATSPQQGAPAQLTQASPSASTVVVHYPTGYGHQIDLRGSGGGLSWSSGTAASWSEGDQWRLTLALVGPVQLKPLFDDQAWALGPNWTLSPGQTLDLWPHFFQTAGSLSRVDGFWSNRLQSARGIWVYLPPSYAENSGERFPVVYLHDGQNLFLDRASFSGISWDLQGAMDQGASDASIHEAILIGIENTAERLSEYTPVADPDSGGGNEDAYLSFIADELKPWVDSNFRTLGDRSNTAILGSSLGGLASSYAGLARADLFGLVGVMSPSTWWDNGWIIAAVRETRGAPQKPLRAYIDSGDSGPSQDDVSQTAQLAQAYRDGGQAQVQVDYLVQHGGQHGEHWWRQRAPGALRFLLGGR